MKTSYSQRTSPLHFALASVGCLGLLGWLYSREMRAFEERRDPPPKPVSFRIIDQKIMPPGEAIAARIDVQFPHLAGPTPWAAWEAEVRDAAGVVVPCQVVGESIEVPAIYARPLEKPKLVLSIDGKSLITKELPPLPPPKSNVAGKPDPRFRSEWFRSKDGYVRMRVVFPRSDGQKWETVLVGSDLWSGQLPSTVDDKFNVAGWSAVFRMPDGPTPSRVRLRWYVRSTKIETKEFSIPVEMFDSFGGPGLRVTRQAMVEFADGTRVRVPFQKQELSRPPSRKGRVPREQNLRADLQFVGGDPSTHRSVKLEVVAPKVSELGLRKLRLGPDETVASAEESSRLGPLRFGSHVLRVRATLSTTHRTPHDAIVAVPPAPPGPRSAKISQRAPSGLRSPGLPLPKPPELMPDKQPLAPTPSSTR